MMQKLAKVQLEITFDLCCEHELNLNEEWERSWPIFDSLFQHIEFDAIVLDLVTLVDLNQQNHKLVLFDNKILRQ